MATKDTVLLYHLNGTRVRVRKEKVEILEGMDFTKTKPKSD